MSGRPRGTVRGPASWPRRHPALLCAAALACAMLSGAGCRCNDGADDATRILKAFPEHYAGVGLELGMSGDQLIVVRTIAGAAAHAAGLLPDDVVLYIDGRSAQGLSLADGVAALRGENGTEVGITVERRSGARETYLLRRGAITRAAAADGAGLDGRSYRTQEK